MTTFTRVERVVLLTLIAIGFAFLLWQDGQEPLFHPGATFGMEN